MVRRTVRPSTARHVQIYDDDWELLTTAFGQHSANPIGVSAVVRDTVRKFCNTIRMREEQIVNATRSGARS